MHYLDRHIGAATDPLAYAIGEAAKVSNALQSAGFLQPVLSFAIEQAGYESNGFKNNAYLKDNNPTGITWINKPYQHATKGIPRPAPEGGNYAHFASLADWAVDFKRILSLPPMFPIKASTLESYVTQLKANGYFRSDAASYLSGLNRWRLIFQLADPNEGAKPVSQAMLDLAKDKPFKWDDFSTWTWKEGAIGVIGGLIVIKIITR